MESYYRKRYYRQTKDGKQLSIVRKSAVLKTTAMTILLFFCWNAAEPLNFSKETAQAFAAETGLRNVPPENSAAAKGRKPEPPKEDK